MSDLPGSSQSAPIDHDLDLLPGASTGPYIADKLEGWDADFVVMAPFLNDSLADGIKATFALRAEIRSVALKVSDQAVALAKLGWWQQEWQRAQAGQARHPVTRELGAACHDIDLAPTLATAASWLEDPVLDDRDQLQQSLTLAMSPFAQLEAKQTGRPVENLRAAWSTVGLIGLLEDLPVLLQRGRAPVPLSLQARLQLGSLSRLLEQSDLLGALLAALVENLPSEPPSAGYAGAYCRLKAASLQRLRSNPAAWLGGNRGSALGRLFAAWRAMRHANRAARHN